jgi:hypothetical protein
MARFAQHGKYRIAAVILTEGEESQIISSVFQARS